MVGVAAVKQNNTNTFQLTELGLLPASWSVEGLPQLSERITVGIATSATHAYREVGVPMFRNQDIKSYGLISSDVLYLARSYESRFKSKRLRSGDLLIARTGYPGTAAVVPEAFEGAQSFTTLILTPRTKKVRSYYLSAFLNSEGGRRYFSASKIGGGQKNIGVGILRDCLVPLPENLAEQDKIIEVLANVDAIVCHLEGLIDKKRQIKQGAMQELLSGDRRLLGFEQEWREVSFGAVAGIRNRKVQTLANPAALQCIELEQIDQRTGTVNCFTDARKRQSIKYTFEPRDVLFGRLRPYLRKYWMADRTGVCSTEIWPLIPRDDEIEASYLFQVVQTDGFIEAANSSYGTHMPRSDWKALSEYKLRVPRDPLEQKAIGGLLSDMDTEIAILMKKLSKARAIKEAMAQELLTGRIRLA